MDGAWGESETGRRDRSSRLLLRAVSRNLEVSCYADTYLCNVCNQRPAEGTQELANRLPTQLVVLAFAARRFRLPEHRVRAIPPHPSMPHKGYNTRQP